MSIMKISFLIGRIIFGLYLLFNAFNHFSSNAMLAGYAASKGVPMPEVSVFIGGVLLTIASLSILTGYKPKIGVAAMILFLLPVTFTMHAFWNDSDPMAKMGDMVNFMKNFALIGAGLLMTAIPTPWQMSLDGRSQASLQVATA